MREARVVALFLFLISPLAVHAATRTWAGAAGTWTDPSKWVGGVAPVPGDDLVFPAYPTVVAATNDFPAGTLFHSLAFPTPASFSDRHADLVGNAIILGGGGLSATDGFRLLIPVTLGGAQTWSVSGVGLSQPSRVIGAVNLNGQTLSLTGASRGISWEGPINGTGGISLSTSGTSLWTFTGANTTTAPFTIAGPRVDIRSTYLGPITANTSPDPSATTSLEAFAVCPVLGTVTVNGAWYTGCAFTHDFTMASGATYRELYKTTVAGTVTLNSPTLRVTESGAHIPDGTKYTLIDNDGTDPVVGTFAGLPEGTTFTATSPAGDPAYFTITYQGGTGNDVVLTARHLTATFTVTNLNDSGAGSLRQAVLSANSTLGTDVVLFQAGLAGTITLTSGEIPVTESVTIRGPGAAVITVSGNNASRIFNVSADTVSIEGLTLTAGRAASGGAIVSAARVLALDGVSVTNSTATTGDGGGIRDAYAPVSPFTDTGSFALAHSTISGNSAPNGNGGGVALASLLSAVFDTVTVANNQAGLAGGGIQASMFSFPTTGKFAFIGSVASGNQSGTKAGSNGSGGGIAIEAQSGVQSMLHTDIYGSRITGNTSNGGDGGGLYHAATAFYPLVTLSYSEVSANSAARGGGLAFAEVGTSNSSTFLSALESTVANNTATVEAGGIRMPARGTVEGVTIAGNTATIRGGNVLYPLAFDATSHRIISSIVADGVAPLNPDIDTAVGVTVLADHSLIETPGTANIVLGAGMITGQDPMLAPLQTDPGSPTQTRDPLSGSPVIDTGTSSAGVVADQRFYPRVSGAAIDMGAVEVQQAPPGATDIAISKTSSVGHQPWGDVVSYTITATNNGPALAGLVTITDVIPAGFFGTVTSATTLPCAGLTTITCDVGILATGQSRSVTIEVTYDRGATYTNQASVTSTRPESNSANNSTTAAVTVVAPTVTPIDLSVTQIASQPSADVNDVVTYTITVTNGGPLSASLVSVSELLPTGAQLVSATPAQGTCTSAGDRVSCALGTLASGASTTITLTVRLTQPGTVTAVASVTAPGAIGDFPDPNLANNTAAAIVTVAAEEITADVPTLDEWALAALALMFAAFGCLLLRAR